MVDRADRDFGTIRVATVDWPIILVEFPEEKVPDAALHSVLAYLESLLNEAARTRQKVFVITDLTRMREVTPASQRQYTGEWNKRTFALSKAAGVGGATVTPSSILRGIITAVFWLQPPATPSFAVSTKHEAMLKGIEMLEAEKILLPPRLVAYRDAAAQGRESRLAPERGESAARRSPRHRHGPALRTRVTKYSVSPKQLDGTPTCWS
jgi:hypothetical protein